MKKLLLIAALLAVAGGLTWFLLHHYNETEASLPAWSDKDLSGRRTKEVPEPTLMPISKSSTVRLAIGGVGLPEEQAGPVADLLTAELTGAQGLHLVERQAIAGVLREQHLSLSGLVRATDAVRIGKLVRADWFLLGSAHASSGTNYIVARMVDVKTGIVRDLDLFPAAADLAQTAATLSRFARQCRAGATNLQPRVFLAIGAFADVGVNQRQAAFPDQLRGYLLSSYQQSTYTLLERQGANALLQEMELDLAGMTENQSSDPPPPLRSAVWLVDGYFQSFETSGFEVELRLQVKRAVGETTRFTLRGPALDLLPQAKAAVDGVLAKGSSEIRGRTRYDEIDKQMAMGKELLTAAWGSPMPVLSMNQEEHPGRRYNLQEAQHAFETVLLLQPDHREAKLMLAGCLADWTVGRELDALPYLKDVVAAKQQDFNTQMARSMLDHIEYQHSLGRWQGFQPGAVSPEAADPEKLLLRTLRKVEENWKVKHVWGGVSLYEFVNAFGTNAEKAATSLVSLWPKVKLQFPDLAPYILASMLSCQVDTNSPLVVEFRKSLADYSQEPEKVIHCDSYFTGIAHTEYDWALNKKLYELAIAIINAKRQASLRSTNVSFDRQDSVKLAFSFLGLERWREALTVFEEVGEIPVDMSFAGPWGNPFRPFLPAKAAAACRTKLGLAPVEMPARFAFGSACVCMHTPSTFSATDEGLWIAIGGKLIQADWELHTNLQVALPVDQNIPLTALCAGPDHIWVGTQGAGLLDYEKATRKCRQITEKDGLLLNDVTCLWRRGDWLWIGFGHNDENTVGNLGGLGNLDLSSGRIASYSQSLPAQPVSRVTWDFDKTADPHNGPPSHAIANLAGGPDNELWMLVDRYGLRHHRPDDSSWNPPPGELEGEVVGFACDADRLVAGLSVEQIKVTLEAKSAIGAGTNLVGRTNVLMTPFEFRRFEADKNSPYVLRGTSRGGQNQLGGLAAYGFRESRWQTLLQPGALSRPATRVLLDGNDIWVAGWGYVAVVDSARKAVRKMCYIPARDPNRLQLAGGYLWAQFDKHLYRVPIAATR